MVLEAENLMANAKKIVDAMGMNETNAMQLIGKFEINLVEFTFDKMPTRDAYKSLEDISDKFLETLAAPQTQEAGEKTTGSAETPGQNMVLFDDAGQAVAAGRMTIENAGFVAGDWIEPKQKNSQDDIQYVIARINDDGSSGVQLVQPNGTVASEISKVITLDELLANYDTAKSRIKMLEEYPGDAPTDTPVFKNLCCRSTVALALRALFVDHGDIFDIQSKPTKRVRCKQAFTKGGLTLLPMTTRFAEKPSHSTVEVVVVERCYRFDSL